MTLARLAFGKASIFLGTIAAVLFCAATVAAQTPAAPRVYTMDAAVLAKLKAHPDRGLIARAIREGDAALKVQPHSVTEKRQTPPSGDKHDWYSQAGYWWPDPKNPNGPYIRHDGVQNPEKKDFTDEKFFNDTVQAAETLALAYYLTGREAYAAHATLLLRAWFLNPATAMNPNLTYAQFIPNKNNGRSGGIVSSRQMPQAIDAVGLLAGSKSWSAADDAGMHHWFGEWYKWLTTSEPGKEESKHPNNHGSWYQVQAAALALYLDKPEDAKVILTRVRDVRIPDEIGPDGLQKYEMARTKSFSYSAMNLHALTTLASMAEPVGLDLWQPSKPGGPTILLAIDALLPYDAHHPWPHEQIEAGREDSICPALSYALGHTHDARYQDGLKRFQCEPTVKDQIVQMGR
jgi:hypothetical protein